MVAQQASPAGWTPGRSADQLRLRRDNLATVLGLLRTDGPWSRARLAEHTGLNRATVSTLVSELSARGLVTVGDAHPDGSPGRPGQSVAVDGRRLWGLGIELNAYHVAGVGLDLSGRTVFDRRVAVSGLLDREDVVVDRLADLIESASSAAEAVGARILEVHIALPGLVDEQGGHVVVAPNFGWQSVRVVDEVAARLSVPQPIRVGNDANLSVVAEHAYGRGVGRTDVVHLTAELGVGAGVIVGGHLLRGANGFAGEVGHLQLDPAGRDCRCGRRGCWETMVGFEAVLRGAAAGNDPLHDRTVDVEARVDHIGSRAAAGDQRTLDTLHSVGVGLGMGAAVLANLFNPQLVVLGGYFAPLAPYLLDTMRTEMAARIVAPGLGGCEVVASTLGFTAAARGGAHLALQSVFADPTHVEILSGGDQ